MTDPHDEPAPELVRYIKVSEIPEDGVDREIDTTPAERAAVAARLGLPSIEALSAELSVRRSDGRDLLRVTGMINADVTYECVVTLDRFAAHLDVEVDEVFDPTAPAHREEVELTDLDQADAPEPLRGNRLELGETMVQCLSLALDPYPRRPGAELGESGPEEHTEVEQARPNPFAVLERLKRDG